MKNVIITIILFLVTASDLNAADVKAKRIVLVTGGNRGIGLTIVTELAKNKDDLVLMGTRSLANGREASAKLPKNVIPVEINLSKREELSRQIDGVLEKYGRVDVLVNNAGVLHYGEIFETDLKNIDDSLRVHMLGPLELIKKLGPIMIKNNYGRIVNVSSEWGSISGGLPGPISYSLTKASQNALTIKVSQSLKGDVTINSMCPGWTQTRMGGAGAPRTVERGAETAIWLANLPKGGPTGKFFNDKKEISW
jgi:NAD(P)-dependent dehydrogenase (short-subunit alcohol dehydrogenase family)